jgi:putative NADH-flavin reductase
LCRKEDEGKEIIKEAQQARARYTCIIRGKAKIRKGNEETINKTH